MITQDIIFEDGTIIICRKQAGVATQTQALGQADMVSLLKNYRVMKQEEPYIGLIHRLDQPVEGIMVFAKTKQAAADLSKQVARRDFSKEYYAVVEGAPEKETGTLCHWLLRDGKTNTGRVVAPKTPQAKEAKLDYEVLQTITEDGNMKSLVHVRLHTGRHHQIRIQLAAMGHPIVGDKKYGSTLAKGYEPLSLCSCRIEFTHPVTGKPMDYKIKPNGKQFGQFSCNI